ncbi:hypothetical protein SLE2022_293430 [Rubroshorea leprosula]
MDLIHKFVNILLPAMVFIALPFLLAPYLIFKFIGYIKRSMWCESVAGKVVLITGASSGIGEHLAYEYARKGARLALVSRREDHLRAVATEACRLGSPDAIVIPADVSKVQDCKRFIDEATNHFGHLDHLVNNAGILQLNMFQDVTQVSDFTPVMNINFWGSVYSTHFAVPHLRKSKGKIIVIASVAGWLPVQKMSFYSASKAALIRFYEVLSVELSSEIGVTIVQPGLIKSKMSHDLGSELQVRFIPIKSAEGCAKAIVRSACRGDKYLTEPLWMKIAFYLKVLCPELVEWVVNGIALTPRPPTSKKSI